MTGLLATILAVYASLVGVLFVTQRNLMYHPGTQVIAPADTAVPEMSVVLRETDDGLALKSWYKAPQQQKPVIVYLHGNAGTVADRDFKARKFLDRGYGVMLVGYRGYGGNPGAPTEEGLYADGTAAMSYLTELGIANDRMVLYGESLGTGVAVELAWRAAKAGAPCAAVVLEAPFTSMGDAAAAHYPFVPARTLVRDKYDSAAKIDQIDAPLYVFHGDADSVVPQRLGKALFELAREPKQAAWIPGASHNNLYDFGVASGILAFLEAHTED